MVKPVYPQQLDQNTVNTVSNGREFLTNDEDAEGAVGCPLSTSQIRSDLSPFDESDVFSDNIGSEEGSFLSRSHSQTRNTAVTLTPAPRERISSLPEGDVGMQNLAPVPRQRRRSAPAPISSVDTAGDLPPALRDIATKGQELFWFILSEEVKARRDREPGSLSTLTIPTSSHRMEVLNERGHRGGRTLRQIAEAFAHSAQRSRVRMYAEEIDLQSLSYDSFSDLLFGLFQEGGVTQARVLVLFFFCSDVALRALRERLTHQFQQLVDWTSRYITERLSAWVFDHGGWTAVLQESVDQAFKFAVLGLCCVGILACSIFIVHRYQL